MRKHCVILLIIFCGFLSSCNDDYTAEDISQFSSFETTLNLLNENRDSIEVMPQGAPVILNFSFQNISDKIQTVRFSDSQQYDLEVYDSQGALVWNWANGRGFTDALTELVFDVDEIKTFEETWDQTSNEGIQVPAGIYRVYVNRDWNTDMSTGPKQIEIYEGIVGSWIWYETSGGVAGVLETPETTGETRKVVFQENGNVTFYTNDEVTLSSTYTLASENTLFSDEPLPVVKVEDLTVFYLYSFPYVDELELQENVIDGFIHNYSKE